MSQPKNAISVNYTSNKNSLVHGEGFRYAQSETIENARVRIKRDGKLIGYFQGIDLYLMEGVVGRFNGDSGLKLLSETSDSLEKLAEKLGLPCKKNKASRT